MITEPAATRRAREQRSGGAGPAAAILSWWRAHPVLAAAVIYALLSLLMVGQGLLPGRTLSSSDGLWTMTPWKTERPAEVREFGSNYELADAVAVFHPFFQHTRAELPGVPLWNPHLMGGRPYMANGQSAILSPFSFPAYVLPFWKSLAVIAVLKLFLAAFGTFLFARALGLRFGGALFAGVAYAFGTFFVVWLAWPLTNIFPLIPFVLLLTELLIRRPGPLTVAGLAALVGLQFLGGHPETSFHVMVVTVCYFAFRTLLAWRRGGRRRESLVAPTVAFAGALVLGTALAALALLPLIEFLANSGDVERRLNGEPSHSDGRFIGAFFLHDYWGRPTQTALAPFVSNRGYYAGGITLMLAACALVLRPTVTRVAVALFGLVSLGIVLGIAPISTVVFELPGFSTAHNGRMVIFVLLGLALLAGWGLDDLTARDAVVKRRRGLALAVAATLFVVPFAWLSVAGTIELEFLGEAMEVAWGLRDAPPATILVPAIETSAAAVVRLSALLQWLLLAGAALALIALALKAPRRRFPAAAVVACAVALLAVDLFRANMGFNPAIPVDHASQPTTDSIRYLQAQRPNRYAAFNEPGAIQPLGPDVGMRYGLYDARGYDYPVERRYDKLWRATAGPGGDIIPPTTLALPNRKALQTLSLFSVTDVMQDPDAKPLRLPGLRAVYSERDARIYRNANALPRVFLVGRQQTVSGEDAALAAVTRPGFDGRRVAVTERALAGLPQAGASGAAAAAAGTASLVAYEPEKVRARVTARRNALLVLTDVHYPGWKARVDGEEAPLERVNYLLRGVAVSAGAHDVELVYEPASWRVGWILSGLGLVVLVGLVLVGLRRRRTPGPA